jgi:hypothetical protein
MLVNFSITRPTTKIKQRDFFFWAQTTLFVVDTEYCVYLLYTFSSPPVAGSICEPRFAITPRSK